MDKDLESMVEYRLTKESDLHQVAQIHKYQFPTHYLGQFSTSLLEAFYRNLLDGGYHYFLLLRANSHRGKELEQG